jgi:hypothetical protein
LQSHPSEIVILNLTSEGLPTREMEPSAEELNGAIAASLAIARAANPAFQVVVGNQSDLDSSFSTLVESHKRLIITDFHSGNTRMANTSTQMGALQAVFELVQQLAGPIAVSREELAAQDKRIVATNLGLASVTTANSQMLRESLRASFDYSSPLLGRKPAMDAQTYPWVQTSGIRLQPGLRIVTNDFFDSALGLRVAQLNLTP